MASSLLANSGTRVMDDSPSSAGAGVSAPAYAYAYTGSVDPFRPDGKTPERSFRVEWARHGGGSGAAAAGATMMMQQSPRAGGGGGGWDGIGSAQAALASARAVGPGSYSPRHHLRETSAPGVAFGSAARFLPAGVGYISQHHNAGLLCVEGPGPKYSTTPTSATYPRPPALGWGDKSTAMLVHKKASFIPPVDNDVGPANYSPRHANIKPSAPRCSFSRSSRFGGAGSYQVLSNTISAHPSASSGAVSALNPSLDAVAPASPRFSFGPPRPAVTGGDAATASSDSFVRHPPRTSFMTHNVRGGLAKPATLECGIGPGNYTPRNHELGHAALQARMGTGAASAGRGFGTEKRFVKPGLLFAGASNQAAQTHNVGHASPGPKYLLHNNTTAQQANSMRSPRGGGLQWVP